MYGRTDMHSCGCIVDADGYVTMFCGPHRREMAAPLPEDLDGPDPWAEDEEEWGR